MHLPHDPIRIAWPTHVTAGGMPTSVIVPSGEFAWRRVVLRAAAIGSLVLTWATALVVWVVFTFTGGTPVDARSYYTADLAGPYWKTSFAFLYSPAAAQVTAPFQALPFGEFVAIVRALELVATVALAGPFFPIVVFWSPLASEINAANINMLIVAVAVWGLRWPSLWALVLLTKVTPGVGLVWFAARREWRHLAIASGATLAIAGVSFLTAPDLWFQWIAFLTTVPPSDGIPLWSRMLAAGILVAWGGRTDRPWTVVIAVTIAMPRLYLMTPAMLVGLLYYVRPHWSFSTGSYELARSRRSTDGRVE